VGDAARSGRHPRADQWPRLFAVSQSPGIALPDSVAKRIIGYGESLASSWWTSSFLRPKDPETLPLAGSAWAFPCPGSGCGPCDGRGARSSRLRRMKTARRARGGRRASGGLSVLTRADASAALFDGSLTGRARALAASRSPRDARDRRSCSSWTAQPGHPLRPALALLRHRDPAIFRPRRLIAGLEPSRFAATWRWFPSGGAGPCPCSPTAGFPRAGPADRACFASADTLDQLAATVARWWPGGGRGHGDARRSPALQAAPQQGPPAALVAFAGSAPCQALLPSDPWPRARARGPDAGDRTQVLLASQTCSAW